jgi:hypothetical protein
VSLERIEKSRESTREIIDERVAALHDWEEKFRERASTIVQDLSESVRCVGEH